MQDANSSSAMDESDSKGGDARARQSQLLDMVSEALADMSEQFTLDGGAARREEVVEGLNDDFI